MLTLIRNEFIKTFSRSKTWVVTLMLIAFCGLLTYLTHSTYKNNLKFSNPDYKIQQSKNNIGYYEKDIINIKNDKQMDEKQKESEIKNIEKSIKSQNESITSYKKEKQDIKNGVKVDYIKELKESIDNNNKEIENIKDDPQSENQVNQLKLQVKELEYRVKNNINEPIGAPKFNGFLVLKSIIEQVGMLFLPIGIMIFFSDMVSGEYTPATLKFLLVQPVSRRKVLISKLITSIVVSILLILAVELMYFVAVGAFTGFEGGDSPIITGAKYIKEIGRDGATNFNLVENTGQISTLFKFLVESLGLQVLFIATATAVTLMISTIFKSSMTTMAISIVTTVAIFIFTSMSTQVKAISHYIFLTFSSVSQLVTGDMVMYYGNVNLTTNTFLIVMLITSLISYIIMDLVFTKRDILI